MTTPPPIPRKTSPLVYVAFGFALCASLCSIWMSTRAAVSGGSGVLGQVVIGGCGILVALAGGVFAACGVVSRGTRRGLAVVALLFNVVVVVVLSMNEAGLAPQLSRLPIERKVIAGGTSSAGSGEAEGLRAASLPISQEPSALTKKDVAAIFLRWTDRNIAAPYDASGKHDPKWDADVRAFVKGCALYWAKAPDAPPNSALRDWSRNILASGCDDPAILVLCGLKERSDPEKALKLLDRAIIGLPTQHYPPALLSLARLKWYNDAHLASQKGPAVPDHVSECLEALRAAMSAKPLEDEDQWFWDRFLTTEFAKILEEHAAEVCQVLETAEHTPQQLKLRVKGSVEIDIAWKARGSGWSSQVQAQGWKGFDEHLRAAEAVLTRAWELDPKRPTAAVEMMSVALGLGDADEMRRWFDRAVAAEFDDPKAYSEMQWGLRERWHGSRQAMLAFGSECAKTRRYDTLVPWQLAIALRDQSSDEQNLEVFVSASNPWPELKTMLEGYLAEPSQAAHAAYFHSQYLVLASNCHQWDECRKQLEALPNGLDPDVAREWQIPDAQDWVRKIRTFVAGPSRH